MAAGLGFKTFTTGEVLTAADVNGYLMQGINVFASSAARSAAITSPQEGQYSFLKDTNALEYYDGAAWVGAPVGDITAVTAGKGLTGGGSSGDVTVSLATTAKGDLVAGSGASTAAVLTVGANNTVLTADSSTATGLKWAASSSGALTKITSASFSAVTDTGTTFDGIFTSTYTNYVVVFKGYSGTDNVEFQVQTRVGSTTQSGVNYYGGRYFVGFNNSPASVGTSGQTKWQPVPLRTLSNNETLLNMNWSNVGTGSATKPMFNGIAGGGFLSGVYISGGAISDGTTYNATGLIFSVSSGNMTGTIYVYGVQN